MSLKRGLRPVVVKDKGNKIKGYFHRFVYSIFNNCSETQVLVELEDGRLRYYDPFFVQFSDRMMEKEENSMKDHGNSKA